MAGSLTKIISYVTNYGLKPYRVLDSETGLRWKAYKNYLYRTSRTADPDGGWSRIWIKEPTDGNLIRANEFASINPNGYDSYSGTVQNWLPFMVTIQVRRIIRKRIRVSNAN